MKFALPPRIEGFRRHPEYAPGNCVHAERVPLLGAAGGSFQGDVDIANVGRCEVKMRSGGDGFRTLEKWLADNAALFLRRGRQSPLVVLPWETWERVLKWKTQPAWRPGCAEGIAKAVAAYLTDLKEFLEDPETLMD